MRPKIPSGLLMALGLSLTGCQSTGPAGRPGSSLLPPTLPTASALGRSGEEAGLRLYTAKCARCHNFYPPTDYSEAEWRSWMTKMNRKARLSTGEQEVIWAYLGAFREAGKSPEKPKSN